MSLKHTGPARWFWNDPLPAVDGRFTVHGDALVVMDAAGQWHLYGSGMCCVAQPPWPTTHTHIDPLTHVPPHTGKPYVMDGLYGLHTHIPTHILVANANIRNVLVPYDQFWASESNQLLRDAAHNVVDAETQLPAHIRSPAYVVVLKMLCVSANCMDPTLTPTRTPTVTPTNRDLLVDYLGVPYPDAYQAAFRAQRVWSLPPADQLTYDASLPPALSQAPPTVSAAAWRAAEEGGTLQAVTTATQRAVESAAAWEMALTQAAASQAAIERERARQAARGHEVGGCVLLMFCC